MNKTRQSYIYALLAILFWSTVPTAFKISLGELSILHMLTIASVTSSAVLFTIILKERKTRLLRVQTGKDLLNSAFLGLINPFLYYLILLRAYQLLPAQVAQPLNMIWPIILVFLSVPDTEAENRREKLCCTFHIIHRCIYYFFTGQAF